MVDLENNGNECNRKCQQIEFFFDQNAKKKKNRNHNRGGSRKPLRLLPRKSVRVDS